MKQLVGECVQGEGGGPLYLISCRGLEMSDGEAATQPLSPVAASSCPTADSIWGWLVPTVAFLPPFPLQCSSYKVPF